MTFIVELPVAVLKIRNAAIFPVYDSRPGQQATNGMRRSYGLAGAQFHCKLEISVHDSASARTMRSMMFQMEGDTSLVTIRLPDLYNLDSDFALDRLQSRLAYPDGVPFAADTFYASNVGNRVPYLSVSLESGATLGDREIYVVSDDDLPSGTVISIADFCYGIAGSWRDDDGRNRIRISPTLRKSAEAGDEVALAPIFVGHCTTGTPGAEALALGKTGTHTLEFVEDLTRLVEL